MTSLPTIDGFARVRTDDGPLVVKHRLGSGQASAALVDGREFTDLPELLEAAGGSAERIEPGRAVPSTDLLPPIGRPRKILCIGQNYLDHVKEGGRTDGPKYPDVFAKWDNTLAGPYQDLVLPVESEQIDYEAELAVVIGRRCRRVAAEDVEGVLFGYTAANDGSVRDYQFHTSQRTAGKAWDDLTPIGPLVVEASSLGGARPDLRISGSRNGELMQDDRTSSLMFGVPELVAYLSTFLTLEPGDLILTGTPAGVAAVRKPPPWLGDGDVFEVAIEGIGSLRNRYVAAS